MIRIRQAIIVEGKYDKIALKNVIDATIIATNGFAIFRDKEKCDLIRRLSQKNGIIVMTDSDSAGMVIRSHLKQICEDKNIINVYVPQLVGKEKRKSSPSKQGFLGVEGMSKETILEALERSGIMGDSGYDKRKITKQDFYKLGLSGGKDSARLRGELAVFLKLPSGMSSNAFLDAVNAVFDYEEFLCEVEKWRQEAVKR